MYCDVLVIGNGIAGSVAALHLAERGQRVTLVTKGDTLLETNTAYAQGGIVFRGADDIPQALFEDIMCASSGSSSVRSARLLAYVGPLLVKRLFIDFLGIPFDRRPDGSWDLFREGAHSRRRILHVKDYTGRVIQQALNQRIAHHPLIEVKTGFFALDLIISSFHAQEFRFRYAPRECLGAYVLDKKKREVIPMIARATIVATGGLNQIYEYASGGPWNTGDGIAMASRAMAHLVNMEYVQFHPTLFYSSHPSNSFLVSEAVRGEGGELVDSQGKPFMYRYHPLGSLAPRDVVARAIFEHLENTQSRCVYLDLYRRVAPERIVTVFPGIYEELLRYNLDITKEPIPVVPGAHFLCGGILTDTWGWTNIRRLYAVGEVACTGLHGANRLASTSLLEGLTFGYRVAKTLWRERDDFSYPLVLPWEEKVGNPPPPSVLEGLKEMVRMNMWKYSGLIRRHEGLAHAREIFLQLKKETVALREKYGVSAEMVELENMIESALLVTESALRNPVSCGTHFRADSLSS